MKQSTEIEEIRELADRVRGPVLVPGDDGYDAERAGFQRGGQHLPAVIVGASGAPDVQAAVAFAAARGLPVAVQATGHGLSATVQGGVLLDTRRMNGVSIDARARTAWIEAGVRWGDVIEAAAPHGLAPLSGSAPEVGAVSYMLAGGLSLLSRRYGYAADQVRLIEVATADGRLRRVSASDGDDGGDGGDRGDRGDLFWALLGGQGNFGVVTGMEVGLVPVARLYGGGLYFDGPLVPSVLRGWLEWTRTVPDEMTSSVAVMRFPDLPVVPEPLRGRFAAHVRIAFAGTTVQGRELVDGLRRLGPRLIDTVDEIPYTASGSICNDPTQPHAYRGTSALLGSLDDQGLETLLDVAGPSAAFPCVLQLNHLGGALSRPPSVPNAIRHRDAAYLLRILSPMASADADASSAASLRALHEHLLAALGSHVIGRSLSFMFGEHTPDQVASAFDPDTYTRLRTLKGVYDPTNMFRCNHNIPPAAG